jgi:hypothetical protein
MHYSVVEEALRLAKRIPVGAGSAAAASDEMRPDPSRSVILFKRARHNAAVVLMFIRFAATLFDVTALTVIVLASREYVRHFGPLYHSKNKRFCMEPNRVLCAVP